MIFSKLNRKLQFIRSYCYVKHDMLRAREVAQNLYKKRLDDNKKGLVSNEARITILGSNEQGFSPSLLLFSEGRNYLFNCGEGLQRYCYSNRVRLTKLENVCITHVSWERMSGLFGLGLTLQDLGMIKLSIHGNDSTQDFFQSSSSFISLHTGIKVLNRSYSEGVYEDPGIVIEPIPIDTNDNSSRDQQILKRLKSQSKLIAYLCKLPDVKGPLDPIKCRQMKVPVGPLLRKLKSGEDVTLADGTIVKSADVCGSPSQGIKLLVLECPTLEDIDRVTINARLSEITNPERGEAVDFVAHFSPNEVTNDPRYRSWMEKFPKSCKHILVSDTRPDSRMNFLDTYQLQYLLSRLDPKIFPLQYFTKDQIARIDSEAKIDQPEEEQLVSNDDHGDQEYISKMKLENYSQLDVIHKPQSMEKINIRPNKMVESLDTNISLDILLKEALYDPEFEPKLEKLKRVLSTLPEPKPYEPELVFLGTGSALPSKLRNTSGILFNFFEPEPYSVIMDAGEDTLGQLIRHFGQEKSDNILANLKMIYISHHHTDHHIGLVSLLRARARINNKPIALLLPPGLENILNYHNEHFKDISETYTIFSTRKLKHSDSHLIYVKSDEADKLLQFMNGLLEEIAVVPVEHCNNSCAAVFKFKIGHKEMPNFIIAYSGDARPSEDFARAGLKCDLLIHEATFDHRSKTDALLKKHSTSDEAISVAKLMEAKFTILTHFSQRLPKIPYFTEKFDDSIGFAFDNMRLRCPSQFARIPILKETLISAFHSSLVDMDERYLKEQEKMQAIDLIIKEGQKQKVFDR